jgi:hypothetical protein
MADDLPPSVITPLESGYIRAVIPMVLPAINWVLYSTNLDVLFHIQSLTTNQVWQGINSALTVWGVVAVIMKRIKEGKDPKSTAPRIVMSKPDENPPAASPPQDTP